MDDELHLHGIGLETQSAVKAAPKTTEDAGALCNANCMTMSMSWVHLHAMCDPGAITGYPSADWVVACWRWRAGRVTQLTHVYVLCVCV